MEQISEGTLNPKILLFQTICMNKKLSDTKFFLYAFCVLVEMQISDERICIGTPCGVSLSWRYLPVQSCFLLLLITPH